MENLAIQLILKKRLEKNFSQLHMSIQLEISQSHYGRIECGAAHLKLDLLFKILEVLGVSYDSFFYELRQAELSKAEPEILQ